MIIILNDDSYILGLKRSQLNHCGATPLAFGRPIRGVQSDSAVLIDLDFRFLGECILQ